MATEPVASTEAAEPADGSGGAWHWWDMPWFSREALMEGVVAGLLFGVLVGTCAGLGLATRYAQAASRLSAATQPTVPSRVLTPSPPTAVPTPTIPMVGWGTVSGEQFVGDGNTTTSAFPLRDGMRIYWGERVLNSTANLLIVKLYDADDGSLIPLPEVVNRLNQPGNASGVFIYQGADVSAYLTIIAANARYAVDVQQHLA